jgi:hypothetical protein
VITCVMIVSVRVNHDDVGGFHIGDFHIGDFHIGTCFMLLLLCCFGCSLCGVVFVP